MITSSSDRSNHNFCVPTGSNANRRLPATGERYRGAPTSSNNSRITRNNFFSVSLSSTTVPYSSVRVPARWTIVHKSCSSIELVERPPLWVFRVPAVGTGGTPVCSNSGPANFRISVPKTRAIRVSCCALKSGQREKTFETSTETETTVINLVSSKQVSSVPGTGHPSYLCAPMFSPASYSSNRTRSIWKKRSLTVSQC